MNPYRYAKKIRTEWLHEGGGYPSDDLNIDLLLERATVPLCQRIDALQDALHDFLMELDDYPEWIYHEEIKTRLRAILEEGAKNENP